MAIKAKVLHNVYRGEMLSTFVQQPAKSDRVLALAQEIPHRPDPRDVEGIRAQKLYRNGRQQSRDRPGDWTSVRTSVRRIREVK